MIGALAPRHRRVVRSFHASLANGADIALFLLLGLLVFPAELPGVAVPALAVAAILLLVGRPAGGGPRHAPLQIVLEGDDVPLLGRARGALPIVLATFPATAGVAAGDTIFNLVFFVVLVSALLQGTTIGPLAKRLDLVVDRPAWQSIAEAVELEDVDVDLIEIEVTDDLALVGTRLGNNPPPGWDADHDDDPRSQGNHPHPGHGVRLG